MLKQRLSRNSVWLSLCTHFLFGGARIQTSCLEEPVYRLPVWRSSCTYFLFCGARVQTFCLVELINRLTVWRSSRTNFLFGGACVQTPCLTSLCKTFCLQCRCITCELKFCYACDALCTLQRGYKV